MLNLEPNAWHWTQGWLACWRALNPTDRRCDLEIVLSPDFPDGPRA